MARNKKGKREPNQFQLPKDALSRVNLGQVFAEYDRILQQKKGIFVRTPAIRAATETDLSKCFFVGRRGTGKTALSYFLKGHYRSAIQLQPQTFNAYGLPVEIDRLRDATQRDFRSLNACFKRALAGPIRSSSAWISLRGALHSAARTTPGPIPRRESSNRPGPMRPTQAVVVRAPCRDVLPRKRKEPAPLRRRLFVISDSG